jgi:hypothetical protein
MASLKYSKYILRGKAEKRPVAVATQAKPAVLHGTKDWGGIGHRISWKYVLEPASLVKEAHSHEFDEFLVFLGCNPASPRDFGAEIEIALGEKYERNLINTASVVCIPRGLIHGPLVVNKMIKPFLFSVIYLASDYTRKRASTKTNSHALRTSSRYSKYILREPKGKESRKLNTEEWGVCINEEILSNIGKFDCNFNFLGIKGEHILADPPHRHNCGEFLFLIPAGYENWPDLGGEVEIALGEDWEKQSINTAAVICLPKGLQHCPVYMKKVEKPFYWGHVLPSGSYNSSAFDPKNPI